MEENVYVILPTEKSNQTISDIIKRYKIVGITAQELLDDDRKNIWNQYDDWDKAEEEKRTGNFPVDENYITVDSWLPFPCNIRVNPKKITQELSIILTNQTINTDDYVAFFDENIKEIYQDEGFKISDNQKIAPSCSVFGWFKSTYSFGKDWTMNDANIKFIDLSPFVISLQTSVSENGGNFVMRLPLIGLRDTEIKEVRDEHNDKRALKDYYNKDINKNSEGYFASKSPIQNSNARDYFSWLISNNDLLFISFEKLEMEMDENNNISLREEIGDGVFDMIALVDEVTIDADYQSGSGTVTITGRDLMKLIIDDGSFFFSSSVVADPAKVFANDSGIGEHGDVRDGNMLAGYYANPANRMRWLGGELDFLKNQCNKTIEYVLKSVLSRLINIEVVPNAVFESWGDKRTTVVNLKPKEDKK